MFVKLTPNQYVQLKDITEFDIVVSGPEWDVRVAAPGGPYIVSSHGTEAAAQTALDALVQKFADIIDLT